MWVPGSVSLTTQSTQTHPRLVSNMSTLPSPSPSSRPLNRGAACLPCRKLKAVCRTSPSSRPRSLSSTSLCRNATATNPPVVDALPTTDPTIASTRRVPKLLGLVYSKRTSLCWKPGSASLRTRERLRPLFSSTTWAGRSQQPPRRARKSKARVSRSTQRAWYSQPVRIVYLSLTNCRCATHYGRSAAHIPDPTPQEVQVL